MPTIKERLDRLPEQERKKLMYSFEHGLGQYVEIDPDHFLGVNISTTNFKNLIPEQEIGHWVFGRIMKSSN